MKKQILSFLVIFLAALSSSAQFSFVHISDLHISDAVSYVNGCDNNATKFQCYIKEFANLSPKPAFVVASGDIGNIGNQNPYGMYPMLTQYLYPGPILFPGIGDYFIDSAQTIPIYFAPGNHEYYTTLTPPATNSNLNYYPKYVSPDTDYVISTNIAVIISMRSGFDHNRPITVDPNITNPEGDGFSASQCQWLRNVLSANAGKKKIIFFHHPAVDVAGKNTDGTPFAGIILDTADGSILNNRTTFLNICDSNHVDIVLSGHVHQNVVANRQGQVVDENWPDSTRYIQTDAAINNAYRIVTVTPAFVGVSHVLISCSDVGIDQFNNSPNISVYPNPVANNLTIESLQKGTIEIVNIQGQIILQLTLQQGKNNIYVGELAKGVYILKFKNNKRQDVTRFVKE